MHPPTAIVIAALALLGLASCGSPPQPERPRPAQSPAPAASSAQPAAGYQRDRDPMAASYDREANPFTRLIVAKMWEAVARVETEHDEKRAATAREAVEDSQRRVESIGEACAKEAYGAKEWAEGTKQSLERRYLNSVDLLGDKNVGTRLVDAEILVLRDQIDVLDRRLQPCPKQYFGPGER